MLQLYDLNKVKIKGLKAYKDMNIESILSTGDKTLSFLYPAKLSKDIKEEGYIRTKTDEFVIKEITDNKEWKSIKATLNIEALEGQPSEHFDTTENTITECLTLALAGTGWTIGTCNIAKRRTVRKTNCSSWDIIQQAKKTYLAEMQFDTLNKKINIAEKLGSDKGVYFMDSLNLKSLDIQSNSYDFYTRIIAIGKDGLKVTVENYQYSNKKKTLIWKDERYTVLESLREDATAKLEELSKPYKAYGADIIDLANISNKYSILSYGLGDTITLTSKEKGIKEKQRIVKITEYPEEPERNTCEIANTLLRFEDIQKEQQDTTDTVNNITADNGTVDGSAINSIKTEQISDFEVSVGKITNFTAINARIDNLYVKKADIDSLNAVEIRVGNLIATKANITDLDAEVARINQAFIKTATIENLNATNGKITLLETKVGSIDTILSKNISAVELIANDVIAVKTTTAELNAGLANVNKLVVTKAEMADLLATNATISTLDTKVGTIDTLINGNLTSANMKAGAIKAGDAIIADGAISNAQIINLDVAKINAGNISTNKFIVGSDSGNLQIKDNTIKVWDINRRERVSLGLNGTDYNLLIRGMDGTTVLFGTDGVTNAGITKGAVDNSKVADNANISGGKIEKESLVTTINGATTTLKSSRIKLDDVGQTLDIAFKNLSNTVTTTGNTVSSQGTSIKTVQGQITSKIWQTDIDTSLSSTNTEIVNIKDKYAVQEQTINGFKTTIADTNTRLDTTNNNVLSVDNKVATVNKTIDGITSNISSIKKDYVTNADASTTYTTNVKTNALEQSINGISSALTDVKNTTLTKADASTTYTTNVKTNALEQNINGFSTRVGNVETTTTSQGKTIASHASSITAMDNAIKLKVDNQTFNTFKSTTEGNISTVNTNLTKNNSAIDVLQKDIKLKVSQDEIDAVERKVLDPQLLTKLNGTELFNQTYSSDIKVRPFTVGTYDVVPCSELGLADNKNLIKTINVAHLKSDFIPYTTDNLYYMSLEAYNKDTTTGILYVGIEFYDKDKVSLGSNDLTIYGIVAQVAELPINTWKFFEGYVRTDVARNKAAFIRLRVLTRYGTTGITYMKGFTLKQLGAYPLSTLDTKINTKVGEIYLSLDGITSRVGKTESATTTIDGKVNTLSTRITNAEQKITPEGIVATVTASTAYKKDISSKAESTALTATESKVKQLADLISHKVESADFITYRTQTDRAIADRVAGSEFSSYRLQTDNLIAQSVGKADFNTYKTQTADALAQRVTQGDVVSTVTQKAGQMLTEFSKTGEVVIKNGNFSIEHPNGGKMFWVQGGRINAAALDLYAVADGTFKIYGPGAKGMQLISENNKEIYIDFKRSGTAPYNGRISMPKANQMQYICDSHYFGGPSAVTTLTVQGQILTETSIYAKERIEGHSFHSASGYITANKALWFTDPTFSAVQDINVRTAIHHGAKTALVDTKNYGKTFVYAEESTGVRFSDYGEGVIGEDGLCYVHLEQQYMETVTTNNSNYRIQLTSWAGCNAEIQSKHPTYFIVIGNINKKFEWKVIADRKGYENMRFNEAMEANNCVGGI